MLRNTIIASVIVTILTLIFAPHLSRAVMAQAEANHETGMHLNVGFDTSAELGADGWFTGPVRAYATVDDPQAVITYSLDGATPIQGSEILLSQPGQYAITWNACKGEAARLSEVETCHDPFTQHIKIAFMQAQPLTYSQGWSFTGRVLDVRATSLLKFPARVAKVQSRHFAVWVVLELDKLKLADSPVAVGDWVKVSIAGAHVSEQSVDWSKCQSEIQFYCSMGEVLDDGLVSLDSGLRLSPSNLLIRHDYVSPHWAEALYWNTNLLDREQVDDNFGVSDDISGPTDDIFGNCHQCPVLVGQPAEGDYNGNPEGWYRSPVVIARMKTTDNGPVYFSLDRGPRTQAPTGLVSVSGDGEHRIAWDHGKTGERVTQIIRIDSRGPQVSWNDETEVYLSGTVDLYGQATDTDPQTGTYTLSGVKEVEISFDGGKTWETHPATTPGMTEKATAFFWNFHWDTTKVPDGRYTLLARGRDYAGNLGATAVWNVVVKNR